MILLSGTVDSVDDAAAWKLTVKLPEGQLVQVVAADAEQRPSSADELTAGTPIAVYGEQMGATFDAHHKGDYRAGAEKSSSRIEARILKVGSFAEGAMTNALRREGANMGVDSYWRPGGKAKKTKFKRRSRDWSGFAVAVIIGGAFTMVTLFDERRGIVIVSLCSLLLAVCMATYPSVHAAFRREHRRQGFHSLSIALFALALIAPAFAVLTAGADNPQLIPGASAGGILGSLLMRLAVFHPEQEALIRALSAPRGAAHGLQAERTWRGWIADPTPTYAAHELVAIAAVEVFRESGAEPSRKTHDRDHFLSQRTFELHTESDVVEVEGQDILWTSSAEYEAHGKFAQRTYSAVCIGAPAVLYATFYRQDEHAPWRVRPDADQPAVLLAGLTGEDPELEAQSSLRSNRVILGAIGALLGLQLIVLLAS